MKEAIKNRYDIVFLHDVKNGNPNGDPDAGNAPRVDPDTDIGIITDVCTKRKIRNYVETVKGDAKGYRIYIKRGTALNATDNEAFESIGISGASEMSNDALKKAIKKSEKDIDTLVRDYLVDNFFDIRAFGAVVTTAMKCNLNCGQILGPVQFGFSESVDPVYPRKITVSRDAITKESDKDDKSSTFGDKWVIPYGLYRGECFISANVAQKTTGFSEEDLELFLDAMSHMYENNHAAARGKMAVRKIIIFKHDTMLGNAPAHKLFDLVKVEKKPGVEIPRSYNDYDVSVDLELLPKGVTCEIRE